MGAADGSDMHVAEWASTPSESAPQVRDSLRAVPGGPWTAGRSSGRRALTRDTRDTAADGTTDTAADGISDPAAEGTSDPAAHETGRRPAGRPRDAALDTAILRAAARQLAEQGYGVMSLGGVAVAAGTTTPTLRRRFRGKQDLVLAAIGALQTVPLPRLVGDPRADALALLESLQVSLARQRGTAIRCALLAEERRHPEFLENFRQRIEEPVRERLLQALDHGVRDGQLRPDLDPEAAVSLLIGSLYAGYQQPRQTAHAWAERILSVIWPPASTREDDPR
jgi:AcrR family transcriptional regulator